MATSLVSSSSSSIRVQISTAVDDSRNPEPVSRVGLPKTSFLCSTKVFSVPSSSFLKWRRCTSRRCLKSPRSNSLNHMPKNFSEENLKDRSRNNCKNAPKHLNGLNPSQMDMFVTKDSPIRRQSERVTEHSKHEFSSLAFVSVNHEDIFRLGEICCTLKMACDDGNDRRIARIASTIRVIPDFPKPGIMFQDITTLLLDPEAFKDTIALFVERYRDKDISVVAGIEARGFIFGPPIALAIGAKFVPMRKPNKLPGEVISEEYSLEYGTDTMEMHVEAAQAGERAIVIDDLIATGGTLCAAIRLLERVGVEVVESACVIELPELQGRKRLGDNPLFVLVR